MPLNPVRIEVMQFLAQKIETIIGEFLKNIDGYKLATSRFFT